MTGPHDFTFVSGLAFLPVPHCGCFGRMFFHWSPICLPLSPLACGCFGRMYFLLSPTFSSPLWVLSHLSPACAPLSPVSCGCFGRMILRLSRTCLPLSPVRCGRFGRMILHLSPTCLQCLQPPTVSSPLWVLSHLSPACAPLSPVPCGCSGRMISHLSPICLPLVPLGCFGHMIFSLVFYFCCLQFAVGALAALFYTCLPLSPVPCGFVGRMILHLSPICLPLSPVRCGCSARMMSNHRQKTHERGRKKIIIEREESSRSPTQLLADCVFKN